MPMVAAAAAASFAAVGTAVAAGAATVAAAVGNGLLAAGLGDAVAAGVAGAIDGIGGAIGAGLFAMGGAAGAGAAFSAWTSAIAVGGSLAMMVFQPHPPSYGGQLSQKLDPQAAMPVVFGRTAVGGNVVYRETFGSNNRYASLINVVSVGQINKFDYCQLSDFLINFAGDPTYNFVKSTSISPNGGNTKMFVDRLRMYYQLGKPTEPSFSVTNSGDPNLTSTSAISGRAAVYHCYDYNAAAWPGLSIPQGVWVIEGLLCYDPRFDSTVVGGSGPQRWGQPSTYVYSSNPFICGLNWALGIFDTGVRVAGIGAPISQIDIPSWMSCANVADTNKWQCGGLAITSDDKYTVLQSILQSGSGQAVTRGGLLSCFVNTLLTSLYTITDQDVVGSMQVQNTTAWRDRKNRIVPQYREESQFWATTAGLMISPAQYLNEDGGTYKTIEQVYPYCQNATSVAQLASYDLSNSREFLTFDVVVKPHLNGFEVGQALTLNIPEIGANSQKVVIMGKEFDPTTWLVTLKLRSETDAKHAFALGLTSVAPPSPALTVPLNLAPGSQAWSITAESFVGTDGSVVPALVVSGACDDSTAQSVLFEYQVFGTATWTTAYQGPAATCTGCEISTVTAGTQYSVAVSYISVRGVAGDRLELGPVTAGSSTSSFVSVINVAYGTAGNSASGVSYANTTLTLPVGLSTNSNGYLTANNIAVFNALAANSTQTLDRALAQYSSDLGNATAVANGVSSNVASLQAQLTASLANAGANSSVATNQAIANVTLAISNAQAAITTLQANAVTLFGATANAETKANASASYSLLATALATNTTVLTGEINSVQAGLNGTNAIVSQASLTQVANNVALAAATSLVQAHVDAANGVITTNEVAQVAANNVVVGMINTLAAGLNAANAVVSAFKTAEVANNVAIAATVTQVQSNLNTVNSAITASITTLTNAQGTQATSITTLQSQIGGGNNLLPYGSFAYGVTGWAGNVTGCPFAVNPNSYWGQLAQVSNVTSSTVVAYSNQFPVTPNQPYTLSGHIEIDMQTGTATVQSGGFYMYFWDATGNLTQGGASTAVDGLNNLYSYSGTVPSTAVTGRVNVLCNLSGTSSGAMASVYFQKIKYQLGSVYTGFSDEATTTITGAAVIQAQAAITQNNTTQIANNVAQAAAIATVQAGVNGANASVSSEAYTRGQADTALSGQITQVQAGLNGANTVITTNNTTLTNLLGTQGTSITSLQSVATGYLSANPNFSGYTGGLPTGWSDWSNGGLGTASSGIGGGKAYRVIAPAVDQGLYQSFYLTAGWYVVTAGYWLEAGTSQGAGVYCDAGGWTLNFGGTTDPDTSGGFGAGGPGIRYFTKLLNVTVANQHNFYLMSNWDGFGAMTTKTINWFTCSLRPASPADVNVGNYLNTSGQPTLSAGLTSIATTAATATAAAVTQTTNLTARLVNGSSVNLVPNSTFSLGFQNWHQQDVAIAALGVNNYGNEGLAMHWYPAKGTPAQTYAQVLHSDTFAVIAGQAYAFQATMYSGGIGANSTYQRCVIHWMDGNGNAISGNSDSILVQVNQNIGWVAYKTDSTVGGGVIAPTGAQQAFVYLDVASNSASVNLVTTGDGFLWTRMKLEMGAFCTPYSDDQALANVSASVTTNQSATVNLQNQASATWGVQVRSGTVVTGISLNNNTSGYNNIILQTDNLYVQSSVQGVNTQPFVYNSATNTLDLQNIIVRNATIGTAAIGTLNLGAGCVTQFLYNMTDWSNGGTGSGAYITPAATASTTTTPPTSSPQPIGGSGSGGHRGAQP